MPTAIFRQITLPVADTGHRASDSLVKTAPSRFGTRKRRAAAKGLCKCGALACGVQPLNPSPRAKLVLTPACAKHRWPQFGNQGGRRSAAAVKAPPAVLYYARSTQIPPRALCAGFEIVREDGLVVAQGCGGPDARQWWHPRSGVELSLTATSEAHRIQPAWLTALEAAEAGLTVLCDEAHVCADLSADEAYGRGCWYARERDPDGGNWFGAWIADEDEPDDRPGGLRAAEGAWEAAHEVDFHREVRDEIYEEERSLGFGCGTPLRQPS